MTLSDSFSRSAPFTHRHCYAQVSEPLLLEEIQRFRGIADELGIEIETEIIHENNELVFAFTNVLDWARFRIAAYGEDHTTRAHQQTIQFEDDELPTYRRAWINHALTLLDELGVKHRLTFDSNEAVFAFDSIAEHAVFVDMCDRNVIHDAAMAAIEPRALEPSLN